MCVCVWEGVGGLLLTGGAWKDSSPKHLGDENETLDQLPKHDIGLVMWSHKEHLRDLPFAAAWPLTSAGCESRLQWKVCTVALAAAVSFSIITIFLFLIYIVIANTLTSS